MAACKCRRRSVYGMRKEEADEAGGVLDLPHVCPQEASLRQRGRESLEQVLHLLRSASWRFVSRTKDGEELKTCSVKGVGKVHLLTTFYNCSSRTLRKIMVEELEKYPTWSNLYVKDSCGRLMVLGDDTDLAYTVTASRMGGLVSPRDWLTVRHWRQVLDEDGAPEEVFSGISVEHPDVPHGKKGWVRGETLVSGYAFADVPPEEGASGPRSRMHFVCAARLGGWLPHSIVDRFFSEGMVDLAAHLRRRVEAGDDT